MLLLSAAAGFSAEFQNGPKRLSVNAAVQAALENNVSVQLAEQASIQSTIRIQEQRAALLPNFEGTAGYTNQTVSLGAQGIRFSDIPIPNRVGPFGVSDFRIHFSEPVLDVSLIRRYQAAKRSAAAGSLETLATRQRVAAMVSTLYFNVQRASALVESSAAQIALDETLLRLAEDRRNAGTGIGLDVTRAGSRLASDRKELLERENGRRMAEYQLLRAMGERLDTKVELMDSLSADTPVPGDLNAAIQGALRDRAETRSSEQKLSASRINAGAAGAERLPSLRSFANYGGVGTGGSIVSTNSVGLEFRLPIFDGGRRGSDRALALSRVREEEIRDRDLRDQIELEVRSAYDSIQSARGQVAAASEALKLAEEEVEQAKIRFEAQVGTQIDLVTAQANLAAARSNRINATFVLKSAEIEFKRATGAMF